MPGEATTKSQRALPTLDRLNATLPDNVDAGTIAKEWFQHFAKAVESKDAAAIGGLLIEDAFWRDMLALTWDFRTFEGAAAITQFLKDTLPTAEFTKLALDETSVVLQKLSPDLAWIMAFFTFETAAGIGSGILRLVPTASGAWKCYNVYTNLEALKGFPERIGALRNPLPLHGMWPEKRRRETNFEDVEPAVVIIGGGQSGLDVGARLKLLDVPTLIVEKNARVGDQWRGRYEALCLHDQVWYDHLPYIPFPATWPVFTPAPKLADWLESYARSMELDVWTSSEVVKAEQDPAGKSWTVIVKKADGSTRTFKPRHVVYAHGVGGGQPNFPKFPGMENFGGKIIHSTQHGSAREHVGKKVVVIGACTSAHDIAQDHYTHGVDVTMFQRGSTFIMSVKEGIPITFAGLYEEGGPPVDVADRIFASIPNHMLRLVNQRTTKLIAEKDKKLLEDLKRVGFRTNLGAEDESGFIVMVWERGGGYYLDVGASQLIIDGKIKLKNDSQIARFSEKAIVFEDGSELPADVVIFATGFGDPKTLVRKLSGDATADKVTRVWGLNKEGEVNNVWRWSGVPGLYFMMGNLALCRFHSKHLALMIKAQEEGISTERYTA